MAVPTYFTVEADYKSVVADNDLDVNINPEEGPVTATVTFTPQIKVGDVILAVTATPRPVGYLPAPIVARIDTDGQLKLRVDVDYSAATGGDIIHAANLAAFPGTGVMGKIYIADDTDIKYVWNGVRYTNFVPVRLLADTPFLGLVGQLIYEVKFTNVQFNAKSGVITTFYIAAKTTDTILNLITEGRVPGTTGVGITRGLQGVQGPPGPTGPGMSIVDDSGDPVTDKTVRVVLDADGEIDDLIIEEI